MQLHKIPLIFFWKCGKEIAIKKLNFISSPKKEVVPQWVMLMLLALAMCALCVLTTTALWDLGAAEKSL